jgi:chaperone LolA
MLSLPGTGARSLIAGLAAIVAVLAAAALPSAVVAVTGVGASERIDAWLAANESFRARFTQTVFDEDGFQLNESRGTVAFRRPYRFRWDYEAPGPQIIVADGESLWWYDIDLEQVTVRPVETALEGTPAALLAGPRAHAGEHFRVAALEPARGVDWIELVPRSADAAFRALRIGLEGEELRAIEMEDGFGQTTRIEFFDVESDPPLADELFRFVPPPEADVVRGE